MPISHVALRERQTGQPSPEDTVSEENGSEHKAVPDCYDTTCRDDRKHSSQVFDEIGALVWRGLSKRACTYAVCKSTYTSSFQTVASGFTSQDASSLV